MEMIDRYVYAVTDRLPENTREDVARELRANIEDMLPENPTENDVRAVLEKLGNPAALSNEYRQTKKYLIGPALYDGYISVLKLVIGIAVIVFTFLALIGAIAKTTGDGFLFGLTGELFADIFSAAFEGAAQAFIWVTVVFVIMERTGVSEGQLPFARKSWTVEDLPPVPASDRARIPRGEVIASLVLTVIFISVFLFRPELIGWYEPGGGGIRLAAPLFDIARLQVYIPAMVVLAVFQFCLSLYKLVARRWTLPLAVANTLNNLALSILVCLMLKDSSLLHQGFLSRFGDLFGISAARLETSLHNAASVFAVIFIILCTVDSISGFTKCRKLPRISIPRTK